MSKSLYRGFSTFEYQRTGSFIVRDIELVKLNILNHIFTRRGSRVMMPTFGTSIPDLVFEPLDDETIETVAEEIEQVINYDPRVELLNLEVLPDKPNNTLTVKVLLKYIELDTIDEIELNIEFDRQ